MGAHYLSVLPIRVPNTRQVVVDGSFDSKSRQCGMGAIFENADGTIGPAGWRQAKAADPLEAELEAIEVGLLLACQQGWKEIVLISDNQDLVNEL